MCSHDIQNKEFEVQMILGYVNNVQVPIVSIGNVFDTHVFDIKNLTDLILRRNTLTSISKPPV